MVSLTGVGRVRRRVRFPFPILSNFVPPGPLAGRFAGTVVSRLCGLDGKAIPPEGEFAIVSAGESHTCGVRIKGTIACWGSQTRGGTAADFY